MDNVVNMHEWQSSADRREHLSTRIADITLEIILLTSERERLQRSLEYLGQTAVQDET